VLLVLTGAFAWYTHRRARTSAVAYEGGFAYSAGGQVRVWRWEDIASLRAAVRVQHLTGVVAGRTYFLGTRSGEEVILDDCLHDVGDLAGHIRQAILPLLFPLHAERYNHGEVLEYGPVRIGRELGIEVAGKAVRWAEVEKVDIDRSRLAVTRRGSGLLRTRTAEAASVPNLDILAALIGQILNAQRASPRPP
jgi:hypothetical protein